MSNLEQKLSQLIQPGQRIYVAGSSNEPTGLLHAMAEVDLPENLEFIQFPLPGLNATDFTSWNATATLTTFFMTSTLAKADLGRVNYLPMQMRAVFDYLAHNVDVYLVQVAKDAAGVLRLGPNVDFHEGVMQSAKVIIAELNSGFVAPATSARINIEQVDYLFETNRPLIEMPVPKIDEAALQIGALVAGLVGDGDCLQTGIGAIPAAILSQLGDKNDLGLHGGLIDDGGMTLIQAGNITGAVKAIDRHQHITGMALGSSELMTWLSQRSDVSFRGAEHTHEVQVIRQLENFVSINSAVEVDLFGQVNAEVGRSPVPVALLILCAQLKLPKAGALLLP
jgi:4-hydroxybutyrate CoA-transferase